MPEENPLFVGFSFLVSGAFISSELFEIFCWGSCITVSGWGISTIFCFGF